MSMCVFVGWYHGYCIPNEMMMAIVKAHNDMLEMTAGFIFTKTTLAHQVFEKLATFNILENQVPVSRTTVSAYYFCQGDQAEKKRGVGKRKEKSAITRPMRSVGEEHRYKGEEERKQESKCNLQIGRVFIVNNINQTHDIRMSYQFHKSYLSSHSLFNGRIGSKVRFAYDLDSNLLSSVPMDTQFDTTYMYPYMRKTSIGRIYRILFALPEAPLPRVFPT